MTLPSSGVVVASPAAAAASAVAAAAASFGISIMDVDSDELIDECVKSGDVARLVNTIAPDADAKTILDKLDIHAQRREERVHEIRRKFEDEKQRKQKEAEAEAERLEAGVLEFVKRMQAAQDEEVKLMKEREAVRSQNYKPRFQPKWMSKNANGGGLAAAANSASASAAAGSGPAAMAVDAGAGASASANDGNQAGSGGQKRKAHELATPQASASANASAGGHAASPAVAMVAMAAPIPVRPLTFTAAASGAAAMVPAASPTNLPRDPKTGESPAKKAKAN